MSILPTLLASNIPAMDRSDIVALSLILAVLVCGPFVAWMIVDCARYESLRNDSLKHVWLLIILFVPTGSLIYFFVRRRPRTLARARSLQRPARRY